MTKVSNILNGRIYLLKKDDYLINENEYPIIFLPFTMVLHCVSATTKILGFI